MNECKLVPIRTVEDLLSEELLNHEVIGKQLDKIIADPVFSCSAILCKFLTYVVKETLAGNANKIKEYTIAVNVLNKPINFKPQQNGIVRIHASRLRRALAAYYRLAYDDTVIISVPNGRYMPIFQPSDPEMRESLVHVRYIQDLNTSKKVIMAVFPFKTYEKKWSRVAFADSIGQRLSVELNKATQFSIISYNIIKELNPRQLKIQHVAANLNLKYILAGDMHFEGANIRIFVRLTDTHTQHQIWSDVYNFKNNDSGFFELSDLITSAIFNSLRIFISDLIREGFNKEQFRQLPIENKKLLKSN